MKKELIELIMEVFILGIGGYSLFLYGRKVLNKIKLMEDITKGVKFEIFAFFIIGVIIVIFATVIPSLLLQ